MDPQRDEELQLLLDQLPSEAMRRTLAVQKPSLVLKVLRRYFAASQEGQRQMVAFFDLDIPRKIEEHQLRQLLN